MPYLPSLPALSDREVLVFAESMTCTPGWSPDQQRAMIEDLACRLIRRGGRDQTLGGSRREFTAPLVLPSDVRG